MKFLEHKIENCCGLWYFMETTILCHSCNMKHPDIPENRTAAITENRNAALLAVLEKGEEL